jgi:hypothetical protein
LCAGQIRHCLFGRTADRQDGAVQQMPPWHLRLPRSARTSARADT